MTIEIEYAIMYIVDIKAIDINHKRKKLLKDQSPFILRLFLSLEQWK